MQIEICRIDDTFACRIFNESRAQCPFWWHIPIENLRPTRHAVNLQRKVRLQNFQRFPHTGAG